MATFESLEPRVGDAARLIAWLFGDGQVHIEHMASRGDSFLRAEKLTAKEIGRFLNHENGPDQKRNIYWVPDGMRFKGGKRKRPTFNQRSSLMLI